MRIRHMLGIGAVLLIAGLTSHAGSQAPGGKTLIVGAKSAGGTTAGTVRVPPGSTTYQLTIKDEDLIEDDILFQDDWEVIPPPHDALNIQFGWICSGGEVVSTDGSSGEKCAEILFCVQFNNGGAPVTLDAGCACCGGK